MRRVDSGGYVSDLSPEISSRWKTVFGNGPSDPGDYDQDTYDRTIELSIAQQKALGINDENLQPVPLSRLLKLTQDRDSGSMDLMDNYAKVSELFRHTKGAVAQAALVRELDQAGLGGILPGGKPGLSPSEVFQADAKAIGKKTANAGILAGKLIKGAGYVVSLGSTERPDFGQGYYEPANSTEKVMMRQGGDALSWAIPVPGVGRLIERAVPRAVEAVGSQAAAQAERSIGNSAVAKMPTSEPALNPVDSLYGDEGIPIAKPQPEDFSEQLTKSRGAARELPVSDPDAFSHVSTSSPTRGGRQTARSPRKSKLDRKMIAEVAGGLFARDPDRVDIPGAKFGEAITNDYRKGYAQANPGVNVNDLVIHHQAERQLLN
ncbi:hypothetical protein, partial [Mesorhizobium sp. M2C.T.Ca.TU.002.02.1.1]|uniref:hypothetical protein n=1 Tax=Mesorhizobium sp. M2C.T.Ca.TU.002.02.1.1 TaxID=2496788 RepID=UPI000FD37A92